VSRTQNLFIVRAIPSELCSIHSRSGDGLDGRRRIGSTPAGGGVGTPRASRELRLPSLPCRPDEALDDQLDRTTARVALIASDRIRGKPGAGLERLRQAKRSSAACTCLPTARRELAVATSRFWANCEARPRPLRARRVLPGPRNGEAGSPSDRLKLRAKSGGGGFAQPPLRNALTWSPNSSGYWSRNP
jgi:hypothetical protein